MKKSMALARVSSEMMLMNRLFLLLTAESGVQIQKGWHFKKKTISESTHFRKKSIFVSPSFLSIKLSLSFFKILGRFY